MVLVLVLDGRLSDMLAQGGRGYLSRIGRVAGDRIVVGGTIGKRVSKIW